MKDMAKLLAKKKKEGSTISENEKNAKMSVLHDLRGQAAAAMGDKLMKVKAATPVAPHGAGPGQMHVGHGSVAGKAEGEGPGAMHPMHGTSSGMLKLKNHAGAAGAIDGDDDDGPGDPHPEHGSVEGDEDASSVGEDHPMHGSVSGEHDAEGPGDEHPMHGSMASQSAEESHKHYEDMDPEELGNHIQKLMAHHKRLTGK